MGFFLVKEWCWKLQEQKHLPDVGNNFSWTLGKTLRRWQHVGLQFYFRKKSAEIVWNSRNGFLNIVSLLFSCEPWSGPFNKKTAVTSCWPMLNAAPGFLRSVLHWTLLSICASPLSVTPFTACAIVHISFLRCKVEIDRKVNRLLAAK